MYILDDLALTCLFPVCSNELLMAACINFEIGFTFSIFNIIFFVFTFDIEIIKKKSENNYNSFMVLAPNCNYGKFNLNNAIQILFFRK